MFMFIGPFFVVYECVRFFTNYRGDEVDSYEGIIESDIAHHRLLSGYPMRTGIKIADSFDKSTVTGKKEQKKQK